MNVSFSSSMSNFTCFYQQNYNNNIVIQNKRTRNIGKKMLPSNAYAQFLTISRFALILNCVVCTVVRLRGISMIICFATQWFFFLTKIMTKKNVIMKRAGGEKTKENRRKKNHWKRTPSQRINVQKEKIQMFFYSNGKRN